MKAILIFKNGYHLFSILFLTFLFISPLAHSQTSIEEKILEKQLRQGANQYNKEAGVEIMKKSFAIEELDTEVRTVAKILKDNGYKTISNDAFNQKIRTIFGRIIIPNSDKKYLYLNYFDTCSRDLILEPNNFIDYNGTYIIKDQKFIADFYYLPEILDYHTQYPNIANKEKELPKEYIYNKEKYNIEQWRDLENRSDEYDLKVKRKHNIQTIIARNMYLFNDNKAQYKWLILNDQYFMEGLVKTYGYTQDTDLLKWVIEKTKFDKNNPTDFGKLFWTKDCDGTARLHANTSKVLQKLYLPNDASENRFTLNNIKQYLEYLGNNGNTESKILTEADRVKIMANLAYFAEQYKYNPSYDSHSKIMGRLRFFLNQKDIDILEKNNYFSLPKFKEWWDNADYDEYFVEECEYNGTCGTDNQPLNITEWRKQHPKK